MFTYKSGYGGTQGARSAGAQYLTREANAVTLGTPGAYYLGEIAQQQELGLVDQLGRQLNDGTDRLRGCRQHPDRGEAAEVPAGQPIDHQAVFDAASDDLVAAATRADFAEAGSEPGKAVAEIRPDMSPRMARTLGIDMNRRLTEREIGNLLGAMTADGQEIKGRAQTRRDDFGRGGIRPGRHPEPAEGHRRLTAAR